MQIALNFLIHPVTITSGISLIGGYAIYKIAVPIIKKIGRKITHSPFYTNFGSFFRVKFVGQPQLKFSLEKIRENFLIPKNNFTEKKSDEKESDEKKPDPTPGSYD